MKKLILTITIPLILSILTTPISAAGTYNGGTGDPCDPFQINTPPHLDEASDHPEDWDKHFILTADIDMTTYSYTTAVIGSSAANPFTGSFDGAGFVISNLTIDTAGADNDYLGLFGYIGSGGEVKNLGIENVNITSGDYSENLGGLCGKNDGGTITHCYATGLVTGGYDSENLGGLCGYNKYGTITNCYATGSVTGEDDSDCLGGLCGHNSYGTITNCYATGSVTGDDFLGGLCGRNSYGTITNCYATGFVTGDDYLGGLCGWNFSGTITNCYATGFVTGDRYLGGLCGENYSGSISNSFWDMETSGQTRSDGGFGRTTSQMKQSSTYNGWGNDIWTIEQGVDYPRLTWEEAGGTAIDNIPQPSYSGSGTEVEPFVITTPADLSCLAARQEDWDKYFEVANDIDMSAITDYLPPGNFTGKFNGNGFRLFNLTVNEPGSSLLGLFGSLGDTSEINNLAMVDAEINGYNFLGGLCGRNSYGTITNCYATGSVTGDDYLGGLCGLSSSSTIHNCYATGSVTGGDYSHYLGGLCGLSYSSTIHNCYAIGLVIGGDGSSSLGGLCGYSYSYNTITNCYATGSVIGVDGSRYLGGLCGRNYDSSTITNCYAIGSVISGYSDYLGGLCGYNSGTITNCYATGSVTGDCDLGGLCGYNSYGTITNCFWDIETSGMTDGVGNQDPDPAGVIGKTTAEMQMRSTFTDAGWDFVGEDINGSDDFWRMYVDGIDYPKLSWQFLTGDFAYPDGVNLIDFAVLADTWGLSFGQDGYNGLCDLMDDDTIDINDLALFAENWLAGCDDPADDPFQIDTPAKLDAIRNHPENWDKHFALTADIDMTGYSYTTGLIGTAVTPFTGSFNGAGFVISNLTIDDAGAGNDYLGLFGNIGSTGEVNNLGLENVNITTGNDSDYLAGLCGNNQGSIDNCYATSFVTAGDDSRFLSGLCGYNQGNITNCHATGSIISGAGSCFIGGLCGRNNDGTITDCYATGSITGGNNSYDLGGLCGYNINGTITNCYATGPVTGDDYVGGFCGRNGGDITACFWDIQTGGPDNGVATPKSTTDMQTQSTFTNWDFENIWDICEATNYPKLSSQLLAGDFACPDGVNLIDFAILADTWYLSSPQSGYNDLCDLVDDDTIDLYDLAAFAENWLSK